MKAGSGGIYRGMCLTGAPAARFPKYLWAKHFDACEAWTRMDMRQRHWTLVLQSTVLAATLDGSITRTATLSMETETSDGFSQSRRRHGNGGRAAGRSSAIQSKLGCGRTLLPCLQPLARMQAHLFQEHRVQETFGRRSPKAASRVSLPLLEIGTHCRTMVATHGQSTSDRANSFCSR